MEQPEQAPQGIDLQEVLAEMDDRTRVGFDAAMGRARERHKDQLIAEQARRIAELENAQSPTASGQWKDSPPPAPMPGIDRDGEHAADV